MADPDTTDDHPPHGWTCFHCGETFHAVADARCHFGSDEMTEPACKIKAAGEFALLRALRNAEEQLARYRTEDSDIMRAMWAMESDHQMALRNEEEKGYARGLQDARLYPQEIVNAG